MAVLRDFLQYIASHPERPFETKFFAGQSAISLVAINWKSNHARTRNDGKSGYINQLCAARAQ
jgi:hypothetical protein